MSKPSIAARIATLEEITGDAKLIVGLRDATTHGGVEVNGVLMSEQEFQRFAESLPKTTELYIVEIVENKPSVEKDEASQ